MIDASCPRCGSDKTGRAATLYAQNVRVNRTGGIGLTLDGDVGALSAVTTSATGLGEALAPPTKRRSPMERIVLVAVGLGLLAAFFAALVLNTTPQAEVVRWAVPVGILIGALVLGLVVGGIFADGPGRAAEYARRLSAYERLWFCLRCGHRWSV